MVTIDFIKQTAKDYCVGIDVVKRILKNVDNDKGITDEEKYFR